MMLEPIQSPVIDHRFQDRWAAWQERGAASDRAARRLLVIVGAILISSVVILNSLWLLR